MLPKVNLPIYTTILPSTEETVKFKPFTVKDEKNLLLAQQSEDQDVMLDTITDIVDNCLVTKLDYKLAIFDVEYLFLQIRSKSVGEISELIFACDECDDEKARVKVSFNLTNIKIVKNENHSKRIPLFDDVGIVMKYPSFAILKKFNDLETEDYQLAFDMIIDSIDYIYDDSELYRQENTPDDKWKIELSQFVEDMTDDMLTKIMLFFQTMPKLSQSVKYTCPKCGLVHDKVMEGIEHFF
jgi:Zn finger protein HypA/HybF involved in hydrogenase expression